jgi:hypothetical protein
MPRDVCVSYDSKMQGRCVCTWIQQFVRITAVKEVLRSCRLSHRRTFPGVCACRWAYVKAWMDTSEVERCLRAYQRASTSLSKGE